MNNKLGWNGISFPFRLTNKGGVATSTTTSQAPYHLEESLIQILTTKKGERLMHPNFGSNIDYGLYNTGDEALINMLKYEIKKAIDEQEPRVQVEMGDIEIYNEDNVIYVKLYYTVLNLGTTHETTILIGG